MYLHWLLLCYGSILFVLIFFLSLEVVLWLGNILLFLDWTSLLEFLATAFVCYVLGVVSLIFLVSIVLCLLIFKKKKTLWVVLANILGYWVIVWLVLWYLLRMACCCLRSLLFWHFYFSLRLGSASVEGFLFCCCGRFSTWKVILLLLRIDLIT